MPQKPLAPANNPELLKKRALERDQELERNRKEALFNKIQDEAAASNLSTDVDTPNPRDINAVEIFKPEDAERINSEISANEKRLKELNKLVKTGYITDLTKINDLEKRQQKLNEELEVLTPKRVYTKSMVPSNSIFKKRELLYKPQESPVDKRKRRFKSIKDTFFLILAMMGVFKVINSLAAWVRRDQAAFNKALRITAWVLLPLIALWTVYSLVESNSPAHSDQLAAWEWDQMSTDEKREELLGDSLEEVREQEEWYDKSCRESILFFWC